jgi:hypothetical protein
VDDILGPFYDKHVYDKHGLPISYEEWGIRFLDKKYRRVAETNFGPARVNTIWLGIDHNFLGNGPPIIFETMIFAERVEELDERMWRTSTLEDAIKAHEHAVQIVKDNILPPEAEEWLKNVLTEINLD